jgi:glyoxylase-like metal-dependent hydrolase (beta-lactamase superfamily II)
MAARGERALSAEHQMADSQRVRQLGDIRVTALDDGYGDVPIAVVVNIDDAGAAALAELSPGNDLLHPVFNAYLVETDGRRLLIDAGAGVHMGPNAGKMLENLAEAGFAPGDVDAISLLIATPTTFSALSTRTGMRSSRMPNL